MISYCLRFERSGADLTEVVRPFPAVEKGRCRTIALRDAHPSPSNLGATNPDANGERVEQPPYALADAYRGCHVGRCDVCLE